MGGFFNLIIFYFNYLLSVIVVSTTNEVVSVDIVESTTIVVSSEVISVDVPLPQETNVTIVIKAKIFFIFTNFFVYNNYYS